MILTRTLTYTNNLFLAELCILNGSWPGFLCMRQFLLLRSFDRIILNIWSFEKDLLRPKKDERIMKSIRMLLKSIIKTRL